MRENGLKMMTSSTELRAQFEGEGRVWLRRAVPKSELETLKALSDLGLRPGARVGGDEQLFAAIKTASFSQSLSSLWPNMRPVRLVSFDKNPDTNWGVPWHQDRIISVQERVETQGFSNWSSKEGHWHCEPPIDLLNKMLFVRVHLDQNSAENGAMEIALGSHTQGKVASGAASDVAGKYATEVAAAEPGDVLVLSMLTLHRSRPANSLANSLATCPPARRVLRVDYAPFELPGRLQWSC